MKKEEIQVRVVEKFEAKLPRAVINEKTQRHLISLLYEAMYEANEERNKYLEKEIERLEQLNKQ